MPKRPEPGGGDSGKARMTRRSVLAGSAATVGAGVVGTGWLAGASGVAAGQITEAGAIPEPERWDDPNLAGFMIHVGSTASPERSDTVRECDVAGSDTWPPDELLAYEGQLINRKDDAASEEETTLYIGGSADVVPGKLYIINRFNRCENGFVGVSLEQIGRSDVNVDTDDQPDAGTTAADDGGSGAFGPGFGPLATVAALLGGGALLRRRSDDED